MMMMFMMVMMMMIMMMMMMPRCVTGTWARARATPSPLTGTRWTLCTLTTRQVSRHVLSIELLRNGW